MSRYNDEEFSKKDMFLLGMLFSFVIVSILSYVGYKTLHDDSPQAQSAPVAVVPPLPPPPAEAKIVAKTDLDKEIGHSFVEIDTKSGYKCFVLYFGRTTAEATMNCQPKPVNPQSTM